ncbi:MAG: mechanosensitive ion channel [Theionarchaea archaeon]|nr:mechanosensitive ion channel [Theionarchaea archaeon]
MIHIQGLEEWFARALEELREILPRIFWFALILIVAYVLGRIFAKVVVYVLGKLEFERLTRKSEAERIARRFGMSLIRLIEIVTRWTIYLIGLQIALETAGLDFINQLMQRVVNYMPNLILALLIFIVGIVVAEKLGDFVQGFAEDEKVPRFWLLGNLVRYTLYLVVVIMALSQLQISTGVLMIVTGSVFATIGLVVALGMRDVAPNIVAGIHLLYEKTLNVGDTIEVGEHEGILEDVGIVKSILKTKDGEYVVIPNSELMRDIVTKR